jgi:ring-1,2-phenylacetyl-CoA epoxidase subunit PaaC
MSATQNDPLFEYLLRMGDNTLILGHRLSEWCGIGPVVEEDIALANIALDLIGQTQLWLELAAKVEGKGRDADQLAYLRDVWDFRNALMVERPNGDYGQTMMRQFLFDSWHIMQLTALRDSTDKRIADIAEKSLKEVTYHLDRSSDLVIRLGDGSPESHACMQTALDDLYPYVGELFESDDVDTVVATAGLGPLSSDLRASYDAQIGDILRQATLTVPENRFAQVGGKNGKQHTEHLGHILPTMQWLQRAYPGATW